MVIIIPAISFLLKFIIEESLIIFFIGVLLETIKYVFLNKMKGWNYIWKKCLLLQIESSEYYKLSKDETYKKRGLALYEEVDGDIWKNFLKKNKK